MSPAAAEHKVLSFIPYLDSPPTQMQTAAVPVTHPTADPSETDDTSHGTTSTKETSKNDPYGPRKWHSSLIKLAGKDRALNEFSVERVGEEVDNNLVLLHGYGAGLGFYYKNFEPLSRIPNWRLYALDMLGMGRSSRPTFRIHAKDREEKITEAENWFIDALEEWRIEKKIDRFTLLGHSLGGYMAVAYALKYPGHLNKLILASPVGIPEDPYAVSAKMPEPGDTAMLAEFEQSQTETTAPSGVPKANDPPRRPYPKWLTYLWDANVSPFSIVRWAGPLGPRLVSGWTSRRFGAQTPEEAQALHDYAYSLFRQRGSGEYVLAHVLAPGAFARSPLIRRIGGVGRQLLPMPSLADGAQQARERGVPVVLMYGDHDWMDVRGGYDSEKAIKAEKEKATKGMSKAEKDKDMGDAKVLIVKQAGHHLYLDGFMEFNGMIEREMRDVERRERLRKSWEGR